MASAREVKLRIRSVKNISQLTRALQAVSASRVRRAMAAVTATRPYASKAWQVLTHIAGQPGRDMLHPLLTKQDEVKNVMVIMLSGTRGLAGAYNTNILRFTLNNFREFEVPVRYVTIGRKGRDLLLRRRKDIMADFSEDIPDNPGFADVSAVGQLAAEEFLAGKVGEVYVTYTDFVHMLRQDPAMKKLLPLDVEEEGLVQPEFGEAIPRMAASYIYEPGQAEILDEIIPRFTQLQIYQAVLEAQASEHAARMVAMKNATEAADELADVLTLAYNKARQATITNEMLDIAGGAEALTQALAQTE